MPTSLVSELFSKVALNVVLLVLCCHGAIGVLKEDANRAGFTGELLQARARSTFSNQYSFAVNVREDGAGNANRSSDVLGRQHLVGGVLVRTETRQFWCDMETTMKFRMQSHTIQGPIPNSTRK
jgi:hypothetical protein